MKSKIIEMEKLVELLKNLRTQEVVAIIKMMETSQQILEQTEEWSNFQLAKTRLEDTQAKIQQIDEQIRETALLEFATTGNKKPVHGVSVVINKKLKYNVDHAIKWCIEVAPDWLKLDTRQFEKHARAVSDTVPLKFVNISEEPSVRIAREL